MPISRRNPKEKPALIEYPQEFIDEVTVLASQQGLDPTDLAITIVTEALEKLKRSKKRKNPSKSNNKQQDGVKR